MIRQLQWLALLVLSAIRKPFKFFFSLEKICLFAIFYHCFTVFTACAECDCRVPGPCFTDTEPPNPQIQFDIIDERGKSWFEWQRGNYIDTVVLLNEQKKMLIGRDTSKFANCYRNICFRFNETPNRETVDKFATKTFFLDLYIKNKGWDRDTIIVSYKSDKEECIRDSIDLKYNNIFLFKGTFDAFSNRNVIRKEQE